MHNAPLRRLLRATRSLLTRRWTAYCFDAWCAALRCPFLPGVAPIRRGRAAGERHDGLRSGIIIVSRLEA
eukprot:9923495-Heterocapsa_arctica.AAC.1